MASIKIFLKKKANKAGLYPLTIRIIKNRKPSYLFTGHYIEKLQWDPIHSKVRKSHPNAKLINDDLRRQITKANKRLIELSMEEKDLNAISIKNEILGKHTGQSFMAYASRYLQNLEKTEKHNQLSSTSPSINHFKSFLKGGDIAIKEITPTLLEDFMAYLYAERGASKRTVMNNLVTIRTVVNRAIRDYPALRKYYPFGTGKIEIKFPETTKVGLNRDEVQRLESIDLQPDTGLFHARNIWLFSFYLAGMRISDVLKLTWSEVVDDRLHYAMSKNDKVGSLSLPHKAVEILRHYNYPSQNLDEQIFLPLRKTHDCDEKELHARLKNAIKVINSDLKQIGKMVKIKKKLTSHIARHTFGNLSGDKIPPLMLQKLYRHSSLTTTIGYQSNFIYKDADEALKSVIGN